MALLLVIEPFYAPCAIVYGAGIREMSFNIKLVIKYSSIRLLF